MSLRISSTRFIHVRRQRLGRAVAALITTGLTGVALYRCTFRGSPSPLPAVISYDDLALSPTIKRVDSASPHWTALHGHFQARIEHNPTTHIVFQSNAGATFSWSSDKPVEIFQLQWLGFSGPHNQNIRFAYIGREQAGPYYLEISAWRERRRVSKIEDLASNLLLSVENAPLHVTTQGDLILLLSRQDIQGQDKIYYLAALRYTPYNKNLNLKWKIPVTSRETGLSYGVTPSDHIVVSEPLSDTHGDFKVYDDSGGQLIRRCPNPFGYSTSCPVHSANDMWFAIRDGNQIVSADSDGNECWSVSLPEGACVHRLVASRFSNRLFALTRDGHIMSIEKDTGHLQWAVRNVHANAVSEISHNTLEFRSDHQWYQLKCTLQP